LNARYLVAIPSSALGRLRAAVGFTVNDRNRCAAEVVDAELTVRNGSTAAGQVPQSKVYVRLSEGSLASATVCMSWEGGPSYWLVVAAHPNREYESDSDLCIVFACVFGGASQGCSCASACPISIFRTTQRTS